MPMREAAVMILTFVFGIVPATALVFFALVIGTAGVAGVFVADDAGRALLALLLVAAAVSAVYGYVALFYAAGDAVTSQVARWLSAGIAANTIGIGLMAEQWNWFAPDDWFLFLSPLLVGALHLIRYAARSRPVRSG